MTGIVTTLFIIAAIVIVLTILRIYIDSKSETVELSPQEVDILSRELLYLESEVNKLRVPQIMLDGNKAKIRRIAEIKKKLKPFN